MQTVSHVFLFKKIGGAFSFVEKHLGKIKYCKELL